VASVEAADRRLLCATVDWLLLRRDRLETRRLVAGYRCELRLLAEPDVGFHGQPACYLAGDDVAEWCEPCRARQVPAATMRTLLQEERRALRRLYAAGQARLKAWAHVQATGERTCGYTDVPYPFVRVVHTEWWTEAEVPGWRPGTELEYVDLHPDEGESYGVAEGTGWMRLREVGRSDMSGSWQPRVFYVRTWVDPDGKEFGKLTLRHATAAAFAKLQLGYRHPFRLVHRPAPQAPLTVESYLPPAEPSPMAEHDEQERRAEEGFQRHIDSKFAVGYEDDDLPF
jgi:hypothetical protein